VEDKQPAAGDLTTEAKVEADRDESAAATTKAATVVADPISKDPDKTDADADAEELADGGAADEAADDEDAAAAADTQVISFRSRRQAGRAIKVAMVVVALLFVASGAFAGSKMQPYLADRAVTATKFKVARTAASAITALWTYTPENMDGLADRAAQYLSGDFEAQYRKFVDAIVGPNKQAKVTNNTEVAGVGVETLEEPNAVVMVYTNTTSTSPLTKNIPALKYLSYRLFMKRANGRWLVTRMTTITSLDLTPHL
jgi:Mce-associated membrane protein